MLVNVLLLLFNLTSTLNIDLWNLHQYATIGALTAVLTGNLWMGLAAAAVFHIMSLALADLGAKHVKNFYNMPGITVSHPLSNVYLPFAYPLEWLFDRIPGFNKLNHSFSTRSRASSAPPTFTPWSGRWPCRGLFRRESHKHRVISYLQDGSRLCQEGLYLSLIHI